MNNIQSYIHCADCLKETPEGISPKEYQNIEVGFTGWGIQVWCNRHDKNIYQESENEAPKH